MSLKSGDLVVCDDGQHGIIIKVVNSCVFEGGEKCMIASVLFNGASSFSDIMSWRLKRINS